MCDRGDEAIESTWKENKCKKNQEKLSCDPFVIMAAAALSWVCCLQTLTAGELFPAVHTVLIWTKVHINQRRAARFPLHLHEEQAAVFTGNSVLL